MPKARPWPQRIRVGFKTYTVAVDNPRTRDHDSHALTFALTQEIILRDDQGDDTTANHLLHEVLHSCVDVAQLDSDKIKAADDAEEEVVHRLAPVLLQVLRDNPELVDYLTGRDVSGPVERRARR